MSTHLAQFGDLGLYPILVGHLSLDEFSHQLIEFE